MNTSNAVCGSDSLDVETAPRCPVCNTPGKKVKPETVQSIVKAERMSGTAEDYALCLSAKCDVVYFGREIFKKGDVEVLVWFKEANPLQPICYCAGVTEQDIFDHIFRGCCKDIRDVQQHTRANTGKQCLTKNPAGT